MTDEQAPQGNQDNQGSIFDYMAIPEACQLGKRVYKKLFQENAKLGATDKKALRDDVDTIVWQYTLKSTTIPIQAYEDAEREYHEVALLQVNLKQAERVNRLAEIVHRAIPYPLIVVFTSKKGCLVSLAHKRFSQAEKGAIVAENFQATDWIDLATPSKIQKEFLASLKITEWPHTHFLAFYSLVMERVIALACARLSGSFSLSAVVQAEDRRVHLASCRVVESQMAELRIAIKKEQQFNRKVELNTKLKELETDLIKLSAKL